MSTDKSKIFFETSLIFINNFINIFLSHWDTETPRHRDTELLSFWVAEFLSCWDSELLSFWVAEILSCWDSEFLSFWVAEILRFWVSEFLSFWDSESQSRRVAEKLWVFESLRLCVYKSKFRVQSSTAKSPVRDDSSQAGGGVRSSKPLHSWP